jgi:peptide/nickel transport system substrate-binding protein
MWDVSTPVNEIIGFGPWIIESYQIGTGVKFKRNDRFFKKDEWNNRLPYLDGYIQQNVANNNVATLKFQNKELDTVFIQTIDFKGLVENAEAGGYTVWNGGVENYMRYITFNMDPNTERMKGSDEGRAKSTWFNDKRFRHAMSYLIDRESLILQAYQGLAQVDNSLLTPASPYYDPNILADVEYNPTKGFKLLEEIGIRDRDGNGQLEDKNGIEVAFEFMTNSGYDYKEKTVVLISKEWRSFGINCTDVILEFNVVTDLSNSGNWDAQFGTITGNLFAAMSNVWLSDGNLHKWHPLQDEPAREWEAQIDSIHKQADYEPDFETRKALWGEMYTILYDELPMITVVRKLDFRAFYNQWGNIFWDTYEGSFAGDETIRLFDTSK